MWRDPLDYLFILETVSSGCPELLAPLLEFAKNQIKREGGPGQLQNKFKKKTTRMSWITEQKYSGTNAHRRQSKRLLSIARRLCPKSSQTRTWRLCAWAGCRNRPWHWNWSMPGYDRGKIGKTQSAQRTAPVEWKALCPKRLSRCPDTCTWDWIGMGSNWLIEEQVDPYLISCMFILTASMSILLMRPLCGWRPSQW